MTLDLWIPARVNEERREVLARVATLHDYPTEDGGSERLGRGAFLVSDHDVRSALAAIPRIEGLQVVQTLSAGVDRIVGRLPAGVTLCNASGVHDIGVAEWIVMAILASERSLAELLAAQVAGHWDRSGIRGGELAGSTVLILGHGSIGVALEQRLAPFGAEFIRVARTPRDGVDPLPALSGLLPRADVVVVLLPLTPETRGLVDADFIGRMKPLALLVNASRGAIVDTDALLGALRDGRIRAALDVTEPEPLPDGHPLWTAPGVLITPHIAGDVRGEEDRAWAFVAEQIGRFARGEPLANVVVDGY